MSLRAKHHGGEGGIRTLETVLPVYHISSVVLSAAQPPLPAAGSIGGIMSSVKEVKAVIFHLAPPVYGF